MFLNIVILIIGLVLLVKGADLFVDAGLHISKVFKISEMLLGLTFVCFGTSLPELMLSITGTREGSTELIISNIIGTNMFNICIILGIIGIFNPIRFLKDTVKKDMYMALLSSVVLLVVIADTLLTDIAENIITRSDGIILILFFMVFMYYTLYKFREYRKEHKNSEEFKEQKILIESKDVVSIGKNLVIAVIGIIMIYIGAELVVDKAKDIAIALNLSEIFISILVVSIGTSLPEIITSITALRKGTTDVAIGNLIGSTMFNTLFVLGISSLIQPIILPTSSLWIDAIFFIFVCSSMILFTKRKYKLYRVEGAALVLMYLIYLTFVIIRR